MPYGPTKAIKNKLFVEVKTKLENKLFSRKAAKAQRGLGLLGVFASWREKDSVVLSR